MKLSNYEITEGSLHDRCYLDKDGWWRFKDTWGKEKEYNGDGNSTFNGIQYYYPHNLIFKL